MSAKYELTVKDYGVYCAVSSVVGGVNDGLGGLG